MSIFTNATLRTAGTAIWSGSTCLWEGKEVATVEEGSDHLKERERILVERGRTEIESPGVLELWHEHRGTVQRSCMTVLLVMRRGAANTAIVGGKQGKALLTRARKHFQARG